MCQSHKFGKQYVKYGIKNIFFTENDYLCGVKKLFIPFFFILGFTQPPNQGRVFIQPLGQVDQDTKTFVKNSLEQFYGFKCTINNPIQLTDDILSDSKKRYDANKILRKYNSNNNVLLLTEKDIVYFNKKRNVKEWGIIGLGYRPGSTCVVSTYRINKGVSDKKFLERLKKVSIHEIGHNLGIDHCTKNPFCVMNDANGSVKKIDKEKIFICNFCKKSIKHPILSWFSQKHLEKNMELRHL